METGFVSLRRPPYLYLSDPDTGRGGRDSVIGREGSLSFTKFSLSSPGVRSKWRLYRPCLGPDLGYEIPILVTKTPVLFGKTKKCLNLTNGTHVSTGRLNNRWSLNHIL